MARQIPTTHAATPMAARQLAVACAAACAIAAFGLATRAAWAQGAPAASAQTPKFSIRGFQVLGDNPLSDGETSAVLAPFLRSNADIEVLQQATATLEKAFRDKGFGLHRVALPPQSLSETVTLNVVKFTMNQVTVEQNKHFDEANIRASLPELQENGTPNFRKLAIQSAIANENPSKQVTVSLRESAVPDKIDATLRVSDVRPWNFSVFATNSGSPSSGRDRITFSGGYANLWNADHQAVATYTTSAERPSDVKQVGVSYRLPLYKLGGTLVASATKSDVLGNFGTFTSTGAGQTFALNYTHHLAPDGGYRGFVTLGLDDRRFDVTQINGIPSPGQQLRRSRPLSVGYSARVESDKRFWAYNLDLSTNLSGGSGNNLAAYQSEDPRITSRQFSVLRGGANFSMPVALGSGDAWSLGARMQFQWADKALISGEQFGLGGAGSVRGTSERPISGDRGGLVSLEFSTPPLAQSTRLFGFVDAGALSNAVANGTTKLSSDRLASVGLGLRYSSQIGLQGSVEYGRVVTGSRVPLTVNSASPQNGDDTIHLSLGYRF